MKKSVWVLVAMCAFTMISTEAQDFDLDLDLPIVDPKLLPPKDPKPSDPPAPPPAITPAGILILDGPILPPPLFPEPRDEPPPVLYGEEIDAQNSLIYVLDMSGSMNEMVAPWVGVDGSSVTGTRADRARDEFEKSVMGLSPSIKFSLVVYTDCSVSEVPQRLVQATSETKRNAISWLRNAIRAWGGTATGPAVSAALHYKQNLNIALMTDGEPGCGFDAEGDLRQRMTSHRSMIRNYNTQGAKIDVFAINPPTPATLDFCRQIANDSGGRCVEIR